MICLIFFLLPRSTCHQAPFSYSVVLVLCRYVRIQLLDSDYLSLAEVQVMGVDSLRFPEVDYSSAQNDFGGINSMKVLLISVGTEVYFIRNTNLIVT
jgi:hypothetical protein